jgi:hypothetical protein
MVVGALAFTEDVKATYSISGSATATFGVDLNPATPTTGFANSNDATFKVTIVPKTTVSKGGEDVYGMISIADFGIGFDSAGAPFDNGNGTVTAKIVAGPIYVKIFDKPDFGFDNAAQISGSTNVNLKGLPGRGGLSVGYSDAMISAWGGLVSIKYWTTVAAVAGADISNDPVYPFTTAPSDTDAVTAETANTDNEYGFGGGVSITPFSMLTVSVNAAIYPLKTNAFNGFGGTITLKPLDMLSVSVGADAYMGNDAAGVAGTFFDALPALTVTLGDDALTASLYYSNVKTATTDSEMDAKIKFTEADADKGFAPVVGGFVSFELDNLAPLAPAKMGYTLDAKLNATLGSLVPYAEVTYNQDSKITLEAGIAVSAITNTTITAKYVSGNLTGAPAPAVADKGILTIATKISY